jgi:xanthine/uracil permease
MSLILSSFQWTLFILANSIVAPLSVGAAFHLSPGEIAELIQRTFFITGLASLLQIFFGHRLPIMEGPAGLWWGVFLIFSTLASTLDQSVHEILRSMEMGFLISGAIFILMSLFRILHWVKKLFTPVVSGTYLILIVAQMSGTFIKGILGIGYSKTGADGKVALAALVVLVIAIAMAYSRYKVLRNYSVLFGIGIGWGLFILLDLNKAVSFQGDSWFAFPEWLAWGMPQFDMGIVLSAMITSLLLLTNLITSIEVVGKAIQEPPPDQTVYNRSSLVMGINQMLAGLFSTVGFVPVSYTAGFIVTTRITQKLPFIAGSFLILIMSFFPPVTNLFSSIPVPVGYAVTFLSFSNLIGIALKEYASQQENGSAMLVIGISFMVGVGSLFIPPGSLVQVPPFVVSILNNGLVLGVLTCLLLEQGIKLKKKLTNGKVPEV